MIRTREPEILAYDKEKRAPELKLAERILNTGYVIVTNTTLNPRRGIWAQPGAVWPWRVPGTGWRRVEAFANSPIFPVATVECETV